MLKRTKGETCAGMHLLLTAFPAHAFCWKTLNKIYIILVEFNVLACITGEMEVEFNYYDVDNHKMSCNAPLIKWKTKSIWKDCTLIRDGLG